MMSKSDLVMTHRIEGDRFVTHVSQFFGPRQWQVDMLAALEAAGHRVEQQDVPGLWRIDGGPELTSNQLLSVAGQMLRDESAG